MLPQAYRFKRQLVGRLLAANSRRNIEPMIAEQVNLFMNQLSATSAKTESRVFCIKAANPFGSTQQPLLLFGIIWVGDAPTFP
jgi:hypothetical protein